MESRLGLLPRRAYLGKAALLITGLSLTLLHPAVAIAQPPAAPAHNHTIRESEHFRIQYDPARVTQAQADLARDEAERAWNRCEKAFASTTDLLGVPQGKVDLHLCWDGLFYSAVANQGPPLRIEVRYSDLDYLGISGDYILTHELAHIFSGPKLTGRQGGALAEGIAEYVASPLYRLPWSQWTAKVLREEGYWYDPEGFFVTGEYDAPAAIDAKGMMTVYAQQALFVQFMVKEFGWRRFIEFALYYRTARYSHYSNDALVRAGEWVHIPNPKAVHARFDEILGVSWDDVLKRWERAIAADPVPRKEADKGRMIIEIGEVDFAYQSWLHEANPSDDHPIRRDIRFALAEANRSVNRGDIESARRALEKARAQMMSLR